MQENCFSMDMNAGSTNLQANGAGAGSLSRLEIIVLRNELFALRDRVTSLERQLSTIKQCTDCQMDRKLCVFCQELHSIQHCDYFKYLQVSDRWSVAKKLNLCYRCLEKSHHGLDCPYTKKCGVNRCRLTHSALLHNEKRRNRKRSDSNSKCESSAPLAPSGDQSNCLDNLDTFSIESDFSPHAGMTAAAVCDGKTDSENMVELNRLAMLAETDVKVPFDLIFGGSCGKELGSSQSRNMTQNLEDKFSDLAGQNNLTEAPSSHENTESNEESRDSNLDLSNNENADPAVKHPCPIEVVVNFNLENLSDNDETDGEVNSLDPITSGGYDPFRPSGDLGQHQHDEPPGGNLSETSTVPPLVNDDIRFAPDGIDINVRLYDAGMFYNKCRMPVEAQKNNKNNGEKSDENFEAPGPEPGFAVKLEKFLQECGTTKETLLDILNNQPKESKLHERTTSPAPPAEEHQKQKVDLSQWLIGPGGS